MASRSNKASKRSKHKRRKNPTLRAAHIPATWGDGFLGGSGTSNAIPAWPLEGEFYNDNYSHRQGLGMTQAQQFTTPAMTDATVEIEYLGLYWEYYHFLPKETFDAWKDNLYETTDYERDSGKIVVMKKGQSKIVNVLNLNPGVQPPLVVVDDVGDFQAIYESGELANIMGSQEYVKSSRMLSFKGMGWSVPVYEYFNVLPQALVFDDHSACFVSDIEAVPDGASLTTGRDKYVFPTYELLSTKTYPQRLPLNSGRIARLPNQNYSEWEGDVIPTSTGFIHRIPVHPPITPVIHKQTCAYDSTRDYLEDILGIKLSPEDRQWYVKQDRVIEDGLPIELTIEVLNELVAPYDCEIWKVWVTPYNWNDDLTKASEGMIIYDPSYEEMSKIAKLPEPRIFVVDNYPEDIPLNVMVKGPGISPGGHAQFFEARKVKPKAGWQLALNFRRKIHS